jgi:hypothetical protein
MLGKAGEQNMCRIGGWNIWTKSGDRIRQFTAAASEPEAIAALRAENPDIEVLSRHAVAMSTIAVLGKTVGDIAEWVPLDCQEELTRTSGVPINIAMKN